MDHGGEVRGIAAAVGEAGDVDVDAGLTAGGFRPNARGQFEDFCRARGVRVFDVVEGQRDDVVAGVQLLDTLRRGGDDDFVERVALIAGGSSLVGCIGAAGAIEDTGHRGGERIGGEAAVRAPMKSLRVSARTARSFVALCCVLDS